MGSPGAPRQGSAYRILALDGGGVKGLFTARVLARLVERRPDLLERADLLAGTSTGGILALALAAGRSPAELARILRRDAAKVFDDSFWDDLVDLGTAVGADYRPTGLARVLRREFGKRRLRDLRRRVLVPAFDLDAPPQGRRPRMWKPKFFHNFPGADSDGAELLVDVALRTSAAPTFFPSYQGYVDGGVVANNPSMAALAQALDPRAGGQRLEQVRLLSLGAGTEPKFVHGSRHDWGWGQWARPLVSLMLSGTMGVADFQCRQILGDRHHRLDAYLERGVDLDDASPDTLQRLEDAARRVRLAETVRWLERNGW